MSTKRNDVIARGRHATVDQLLDTFHSSARKADLATYFGCFDQRGRFLGTDATENWSATEFYDFTKPHFATGKGWTYIPTGQRQVTYYPGPSSDNAAFCTFDEQLHNDGFGSCRGSGTLIRDETLNCWLIASYHLTFPVPNDIAHKVTDLIKSADSTLQSKQADAAAAQLLAELELEGSGVEKAGGGGKGSRKKKGK
jgi:hypothetical protein